MTAARSRTSPITSVTKNGTATTTASVRRPGDSVGTASKHRDLVDRLEGHHVAGPAPIMGNRLDRRNVHVAVIVAHDVVLASSGVRSWYHTTP